MDCMVDLVFLNPYSFDDKRLKYYINELYRVAIAFSKGLLNVESIDMGP